MFIDASAIVAILNDEPEAAALEAAIDNQQVQGFVSPIVRFEAIVSLAAARGRKTKAQTSPEAIRVASAAVAAFVEAVGAHDAPIDSVVGDSAVAAAAAFGRVFGHKADLSLGDCFAYAIAGTHRQPILFKGNDFANIDLKSALPEAAPPDSA